VPREGKPGKLSSEESVIAMGEMDEGNLRMEIREDLREH